MPESRTILTTKKTGTSQYLPGDLSLFPTELDDDISLYETKNNSITVLTGRLSITGTIISVNNTNTFPDEGILRINDELIYYREKDDRLFTNLIRGFNGSRLMIHDSGSLVLGSVSSLHHNSTRDSILKCEQKTGLLEDKPDINGTLTSRVKFLDIKWFTPTARFYGKPTWGVAPLTVNFRNFSLGDPYIKSVWDFGDPNSIGDISAIHPVHVYEKPGVYTVGLTIQSNDGRSSTFSKKDYIKVLDLNSVLHVLAYARDPNTKEKLNINSNGRPSYNNDFPLAVEFVDQTIGTVLSRLWIYGDGETTLIEDNPYQNIVQHTYKSPGTYWPELKVIDQSGISRFYRFPQPIIIGDDFVPLTKEELIFGNINSTNISSSRPLIDQFHKIKKSVNTLSNSLVF
jgi:hypothetical protein